MATAPLDRLEAARLDAARPSRRPTPNSRLVALGWATVDLDRTLAALTAGLGVAGDGFVEAPESVALGARCRVLVAALADGVALAILEPSTEGRLATTLARLDEGPSIAWYWSPDGTGPGAGQARSGPFGPERPVAGDPVHGPHRFLIEGPAGTIAP